MTWYRFHGICGPGHQSSWEEYRWLEGDLDEEFLEEVWEESMPNWAEYSGNSSGSHEIVVKLPPKIYAEKIRLFQDRLSHAKYMLEILDAKEEK